MYFSIQAANSGDHGREVRPAPTTQFDKSL